MRKSNERRKLGTVSTLEAALTLLALVEESSEVERNKPYYDGGSIAKSRYRSHQLLT
jgi:hypothetical protein